MVGSGMSLPPVKETLKFACAVRNQDRKIVTLTNRWVELLLNIESLWIENFF